MQVAGWSAPSAVAILSSQGQTWMRPSRQGCECHVQPLSMTASKVGDSFVGALRPACRAEPRVGGRSKPCGRCCVGSAARCACSAYASGALPRAGRGASSSENMARSACNSYCSGVLPRAGGAAELRVGSGATPQAGGEVELDGGGGGCGDGGGGGGGTCACSTCAGSSADGEARPGQREQRLPRRSRSHVLDFGPLFDFGSNFAAGFPRDRMAPGSRARRARGRA